MYVQIDRHKTLPICIDLSKDKPFTFLRMQATRESDKTKKERLATRTSRTNTAVSSASSDASASRTLCNTIGCEEPFGAR
ncbi:hypothetical protein H9L39_04204 [Fusarium oxysporum f. sp. albedinis]|nr:hypothetical protein H9L39_04204 [Fusarium oxysporum f. sp. albedinis]